MAPLVNWLRANETRGTAEELVDRSLRPVAAMALADIARGSAEVQARVAAAGAIEPLVSMLAREAGTEAAEAACSALATLSKGNEQNQIDGARAGAVPLLVGLIEHPKVCAPPTCHGHARSVGPSRAVATLAALRVAPLRRWAAPRCGRP